jgi:hypothetical protein
MTFAKHPLGDTAFPKVSLRSTGERPVAHFPLGESAFAVLYLRGTYSQTPLGFYRVLRAEWYAVDCPVHPNFAPIETAAFAIRFIGLAN